MQVILTEDVPHLGNMGDVVTVKPGYGRNYLIPRGLAVQATPGNRAQMEHTIRRIEERRARLRIAASELGSKLEGLSITIARQSGEDDRLFGSVTNRDIEAALAALGHEIDKRRIMLKDAIRALGIYEVPVKLHADVTSNVKVWVCALASRDVPKPPARRQHDVARPGPHQRFLASTVDCSRSDTRGPRRPLHQRRHHDLQRA